MNCYRMATEWVYRAQYFYDLWFESDDGENFRYTDEDLNGYIPQIEFTRWMLTLDMRSPEFKKAEDVCQIVPVSDLDD